MADTVLKLSRKRPFTTPTWSILPAADSSEGRIFKVSGDRRKLITEVLQGACGVEWFFDRPGSSRWWSSFEMSLGFESKCSIFWSAYSAGFWIFQLQPFKVPSHLKSWEGQGALRRGGLFALLSRTQTFCVSFSFINYISFNEFKNFPGRNWEVLRCGMGVLCTAKNVFFAFHNTHLCGWGGHEVSKT